MCFLSHTRNRGSSCSFFRGCSTFLLFAFATSLGLWAPASYADSPTHTSPPNDGGGPPPPGPPDDGCGGSATGGGPPECSSSSCSTGKCPEDDDTPDPGEEGGGCEAKAGDPIDLTNGEFYLHHRFLSQPSRVPMHVDFRYSSFARYHGTSGFGWTHNYAMRIYESLEPAAAGGGSEVVIVVRYEGGQIVRFRPTETAGLYLRESRIHETVTINGDGSYTLENEAKLEWQFDSEGRLTAISNGMGEELRLTYEAGGRKGVVAIPIPSNLTEPNVVSREERVETVERCIGGVPSGQTLTFAYDATGHLESVTDQGGRKITLSYQPDTGKLLKVIDPVDQEYSYTYNSDHLIETFVALGCSDCVVRKNTYSGNVSTGFKVVRQVQGTAALPGEDIVFDYQNTYTDLTYTITGLVVGQTTERKERAYMATDAFGNKKVIERVVMRGADFDAPENTRRKFAYDPATGYITSRTFKNGATATYVRDTRNNILTETRSLRPAEGADTPETEDDIPAVNIVTTMTYDANDNRLSRSIVQSDRPDEEFVEEWEYDAEDRVTAEKRLLTPESTDELGAIVPAVYITTSYEYTADGLLLKSTDPNGNERMFEYTDGTEPATGGGTVPAFLKKREYDPANPEYEMLSEYDSLGRLTSTTDPLDRETTYEFDDLHRLVRMVTPDDTETVNTYTGSNLTEVKIGNYTEGYRITRYEYDGLNRANVVKRVKWVDAEGNHVSAAEGTEEEEVQTESMFDSEGRLIVETNALGQMTTHVYDTNGWRTKKIVPYIVGQDSETSWTYDNAGRVVTMTDPIGVITTYAYDDLDRVISMTEADGLAEERVTGYSFDAQGNQVERRVYSAGEAELLATTYYFFDRIGRKIGVNWNPATDTIAGDRELPRKMEYDENGNLIAATDGRGYRTVFDHDTYNRLGRTIYPDRADYLPDGNDTVVLYDLVGNRVQTTDGRGIHRYFRYDNRDRLTHASVETDEDWSLGSAGEDWHLEPNKVAQKVTAYNCWSQPVDAANIAGATAASSYDHFGRLATKIETGQPLLIYSYDALDKLVSTAYPAFGANPATSVVSIYSSINGKLLNSVSDRSGTTTSFGYSSRFRRAFVTSSLNQVSGDSSISTYDALGRVTTVANELGETTIYSYDVFDQVRAITHPDHIDITNERITTYLYDNYGQVIEVTGSDTYPVSYSYDLSGNHTSLKDRKGGSFASGASTIWAYDSRNRPITKTYADTTSYTVTYDANGQVATRADAKNQVTTYTYEEGRNLLAVADHANDSDWIYTYDTASRLTDLRDASGLTEWDYDAAGRVTVYRQNALGRQIAYTYDSESRRSTMAVGPVGVGATWTTTYSYDEGGRLAEILDDKISTADPFVYTWKNNISLVEAITLPGGAQQTKTYDALGRLEEIGALNAGSSSEVNRFAYTYDAAGQRKGVTLKGGAKISYTYDEKRQLVGALNSIHPLYDFAYGFDEIGNRTLATESGTTTSYTPNPSNQYTEIASVSPVHDLNGSLASDGLKQYSWDESNRLSIVIDSVANKRIENSYDGIGRRVERRVYASTDSTVPDTVTRYLFDSWNVVQELDGSNSEQKTYTRGLDLTNTLQGAGGVGGLLAAYDVGMAEIFYYFYDGNGNVSDLLDPADSVRASYVYDPFGQIFSKSGDYAETNTIRFSTKEIDVISGLSYFGFRYYDSSIGGWLSRDPLEERGGVNLYAYGPNSPVNGFDVLGGQWVEEEVFKILAEPFEGLGNEIERSLREASQSVMGALDGEFEKFKSDSKKRYKTTFRLRKDIISNDLVTLWVGGQVTISSDGCCISVTGSPAVSLTLKSPRFLVAFQWVGGLSGNLSTSWTYCHGSDTSEWKWLHLGINGKFGLRGSLPGRGKIPGLKSAFAEGGVFAKLDVDLLQGWSSRRYSSGWYAQASLRVDVGFWDYERIWGTSSGDFDFF